MTLGHAHLQGRLFLRHLGIPRTKSRTKFEVFSSSSFGAIDAAVVDMKVSQLNSPYQHATQLVHESGLPLFPALYGVRADCRVFLQFSCKVCRLRLAILHLVSHFRL